MASLRNDVRFAFRQIYRSPGFALAVIVTLTLGVGVNTAVFTMVDGFMLRSLPYPQPKRIGAVLVHKEGVDPRSGKPGSVDMDNFTGASWQILKDNVSAGILAFSGGTDGVNLKVDSAAGNAIRYVHDSRVSADYFGVLGIPMYLGRSFNAEEDRQHGPSVVVLSYGLWKSVFASNPRILGRSIELKGQPFTVIGVLPKNGVTPSNADLFTPLQPATTGECGGSNCRILVRLKPGATWQQVNAQLSHVRLPDLSEVETVYHGREWVYVLPLERELAGALHDAVAILMLAVGFILLIACGNLAGLALVRISRRTLEIATRLALGASRFDVLRQLWVENLLLALVGALTGLCFALAILKALRGFLPSEMIPMGGFSIDLRVLGFTFTASLLTSLFFGALPALHARRVDLRSAIAAGSKTISGGSNRTRQWLIGAEVALTVILLAAAGLLVRTLVYLETLPPGFDPHNVMTAKASLDDARYYDSSAFQALLQKSIAAMRQIPGVQDAAVGLSVPYEAMLNDFITIADGKQAGRGDSCSFAYVTPGYFSTLRIPLLAGRTFTDSDTATSQPVAIVTASFGKNFFNRLSPVGRHFKSGDRVYTIVGVTADVLDQSKVHRSAPIGTEPIFYVPATQVSQNLLNLAHIWFQPSWIVRTYGPIQGLTADMQHALGEADPDLPFSGFYSMEQILTEQVQQQRIEVLLLATLAGLALLLSAVGIYGLVSNLVVQRTREIGIRIALGSTIHDAMFRIGSSGIAAAGAGLLSGVALSLLALRVLSSEIYGVRANDAPTLIVVVAVLALIAVAASILPTLRIIRIQPAEILRSE